MNTLHDLFIQYVSCTIDAFSWLSLKTESLGVIGQPVFLFLFVLIATVILPQWVFLAIAFAIGIPFLALILQLFFVARHLERSR